MAYLECKNLFKVWPSVTLDLSFSCKEGSITSIVGPSGSGKSTLLRLIAGLLPPDQKSGCKTQIMLGKKDITRLAPAKRGVGMVFQNGALFLHKTVLQNVMYGLRCKGIAKKEAKEKAQEMLSLMNLADFGERRPETLSGGEAQRVALARTLVVEPSLVLLDEPLSALDAPLRKKLAGDICALKEKLHFTALMVTHDIAEARYMSQEILAIEKGKKVWQGPAKDFQRFD